MDVLDLESVQAVKSIVETIAVVIGGLWIAWTFHKLQSVRASEADISNKLREADKSQAETHEAARRLLSQQPNLEIEFDDFLEHTEEGVEGGSFLGVTLHLRNTGSRNLVVEFDETTLSVARFVLRDRELREMSEVYRTAFRWIAERGTTLVPVEYRILRVGQQRQIVVVAPARTPGLYLVQFRALYYMLPFDSEPTEEKVFPIQAMQQHLVRLPLADNS